MQSLLQQLQLKYPLECQFKAVIVSVHEQSLYLFEQGKQQCVYPVSTSRFGTGNFENSYQTPTGAHRIKEKIGAGLPLGSVLVGRQPTGEICVPDQSRQPDDKDFILSRILWLDGLEENVNRGGRCDTYRRYIYIHGTHAEGLLGTAASHGCIRMANSDVIELFDVLRVGDLVYIC